MSIEATLEKIATKVDGVLAAVLVHEGGVVAHLDGPYSVLPQDDIADLAISAFAMIDEVETVTGGAKSIAFEFENQSLLIRRIEQAVLLLILEPLREAQMRKLKVGVNVFLKPIKTLLEDMPPPERAVSDMRAKTLRAKRFEPEDLLPREPEEPLSLEQPVRAEEKPEKKKKRFYRGIEY